MAASLIISYRAIRRREIRAQRAWMIRGYALGLGALTQVLTHLPYFVLVGGDPAGNTRAVLMGAGWAINLAVAEWLIRARPSLVPKTQSTSPILSSAA